MSNTESIASTDANNKELEDTYYQQDNNNNQNNGPSRRFFFTGSNPFDSLFGYGGGGGDIYDKKDRCQFIPYHQYGGIGQGIGQGIG